MWFSSRGLIGGPIVKYLVGKYNLTPDEQETEEVEYENKKNKLLPILSLHKYY